MHALAYNTWENLWCFNAWSWVCLQVVLPILSPLLSLACSFSMSCIQPSLVSVIYPFFVLHPSFFPQIPFLLLTSVLALTLHHLLALTQHNCWCPYCSGWYVKYVHLRSGGREGECAHPPLAMPFLFQQNCY